MTSLAKDFLKQVLVLLVTSHQSPHETGLW